uniref:NAD-dependent epimerase/dehydratase family protein n=1 Tax=Rhodanobacter glycinis TaxID=582702 RepID=UPI00155A3889|nr:NAD(P)-dependent oxidoreductase [Rhodanobacter glycinis]
MNSLAGKIVLVTGATGFIGRHLVDRLRMIPGISLILLSRSSKSDFAPEAAWVTSALDRLTRNTWLDHGIDRIDVIFHFGAYTPKKSSEGNEVDEVYHDNLIGTRALLESLPCTPERFVFSSTLDVYSTSEASQILTEESRLSPASLYGASKVFCEHLVRVYAEKLGYAYAILRFGHIYGPGEGAYVKLIPQVIRSMLKHESPVIYGDGSAQRDFMFVDDAVEAAMRAATAISRQVGPLNVVSGQSRSIREFVEVLSRVSGFSGKIEYQAEKPNGVSLMLSAKKMFDVLGQWELCALEDGLRQEVNYFRSGDD